MPKTFRPEKKSAVDEVTGATVWQMTDHPSVHHHLYFTNPSFTADGRFLIFVSYRLGPPHLFAAEVSSGEIRRLTDRPDLNTFSGVPTRDGRVVFTAGEAVRAVEVATGRQETLASFPGASLSNCHLSADGSMVATNVKRDGRNAITAVRVDGSGARTIFETAGEVGHIQFSPRTDNTILYSGDVKHRVRLVDFDGSNDRLLYRQPPTEWITHESWLGAGDEVMFVHWPRAVRAIRRDGTGLRTIAGFTGWHPSSRRDGPLIVSDTHLPDIGLQLIDPATGAHRTLCHPKSSNKGTQWAFDLPAEEAPIPRPTPRDPAPPATGPDLRESTYGPQWTRPHPSFSADGRWVAFTSDRTGWSQVYIVEVPS
ncbi:MAG: hypothetical protein A3F84_10745 [Candidatus Handelsmanbacteria bacterium RIFCSPLOWO2_12_FULL_64_10]|uniref:Oligogalacturonate lyase domain-containing protein n=1 Tax=Handelsmanbacteria sp. (strain RIFCSPLOWO2_12_FULL_64_10) TaxID=1817868 RepID=A0A1F6D788_HANXR|nr:MAG: hypothetical protein A3F84_10745 [Candidatus Handelsmanbacteria bacterium RIFCSPLOWO2_12_FULL_64_10]